MAKKKAITKNYLISKYMETVLEEGSPKSVYSFSKKHQFSEAEFYNIYGNFEALEGDIFKTFLQNSIDLIEKSEEYVNFDTRNKLLTLYYTFFETLKANRSYIMASLGDKKNSLGAIKKLTSLRTVFKEFIKNLEWDLLDLKKDRLKEVQSKSLEEGAWIQLLLTLKFWLDDQSPSFEKTDIFIEKSVNATFDLLGVKPLQSLLDLGKFLVKEKLQ
ncbi:TetR family transcriptional regulator C-terminal domain-containing protein [Namhaeicola litoreus]|uniref:TetR family transcriptional regulator C-terminal domain-containing protein n=1 Tax=Namhaeicola litoreus TaxID=1052145 RepID=A0ABW3Y7J9_9FLAO